MSTPSTKTAFQQYLESEAYQTHKAKVKAFLAEEETDTQALYDQGFAAGVAAGKMEEQKRMASIEAQSLPGHEALVQRLKWEGKTTSGEAAVQILAAEKARQMQMREAVMADAPPPLPPVLTEEAPIASLSLAARCQKEWESSAALQAEFIEAAVYVAYREAETAGLIKTVSKEKATC